MSEEMKNKMSLLNRGENNYFYGKKLIKELNGMYGKTHSDKVKNKLSLERKGIGNPCYNRIWVTNGIENKYIKKEDLIENGWRRGRTIIKK